MNPDIAIVVIAYNRPEALRRLLQSVAAADYPGEVKLYISVDGGREAGRLGGWEAGKKGGGEAGRLGGGDEVRKIAADFKWRFGEKELIFHDVNMGLREHVLRCGDLSAKHDALIALEDDLVVSPRFYHFALQAFNFYKDDPKIAGISLYHHAYNETAQFPFVPLADGSDVYFLQYASSWGQVWTKEGWERFREWYGKRITDTKASGDKLPPNIKLWPENSWKKYFIEFLIEKDLFFVFPRVSMTTIFSDEGTNIRLRETFLQVPLFYGERDFHFKKMKESVAVYDTWCEILPDRLKKLWPALRDEDFGVDLYGMKPSAHISQQKIISGRKCKKPEKLYGREMKPHEENLLYEVKGEYFNFGRREEFEDPPYFARLLKCHEKRELAYWYPIREYHFYRNRLLSTDGKAASPSKPLFLTRKFLTTFKFALRYFSGKK